MGLTAFSGNDGIHVFVNSLASTEAIGKAEVRLIARNNEILATERPTMPATCCSRQASRGARVVCRPRMLTVTVDKADYAFLSLKSSAFDLTDRGVSGRAVPAGPMRSSIPSAASIAPARRFI